MPTAVFGELDRSDAIGLHANGPCAGGSLSQPPDPDRLVVTSSRAAQSDRADVDGAWS